MIKAFRSFSAILASLSFQQLQRFGQLFVSDSLESALSPHHRIRLPGHKHALSARLEQMI
jgi:hypothetical protein